MQLQSSQNGDLDVPTYPSDFAWPCEGINQSYVDVIRDTSYFQRVQDQAVMYRTLCL
jgi:hypothetical protein